MNANDKQIEELIKVVEEKKAKLGKKKRSSLVTNGLFKYDDDNFFNINTISNIDTLVNALAYLLTRKDKYEEACRRLGVSIDFKWYGYTLEDWEEDFQARIDFIQWNEDKKSLDATQKKLDSLISSEGKTSMEIEKYKALLGV